MSFEFIDLETPCSTTINGAEVLFFLLTMKEQKMAARLMANVDIDGTVTKEQKLAAYNHIDTDAICDLLGPKIVSIGDVAIDSDKLKTLKNPIDLLSLMAAVVIESVPSRDQLKNSDSLSGSQSSAAKKGTKTAE